MKLIGQAALYRLLLSTVLLGTSLIAQENSGRILGQVLDVSGAAVPEAKVVATSPRVPRGIESTTDALGNYVLSNLPIDIYTVTVSREGFATVKRAGIDVQRCRAKAVDCKFACTQFSNRDRGRLKV